MSQTLVLPAADDAGAVQVGAASRALAAALHLFRDYGAAEPRIEVIVWNS